MATSTSLALGNAPRLRPLSVRANSRSPSRSPIRKTQFAAHELDPLLGNLSPESILHAFSASETPSTKSQKSQDILRASIENASTAERELAIKAALAAQKVQQWLAEISSWHWPDHKASAQGAGFLQPIHRGNGEQGAVAEQEDIYMGSLRAEVVRKYERCLEEIKDGLEELDVRDLKEHVLDAHVPSRSRPSTRNGPSEVTTRPSGHGHLGDLTAVITATIMQTLPYLTELNMLISIWDVRIAVLLSVPELVQRLQATRAAVEEALREVRAEKASSAYNKSQFDITKEKLQREVSSLGVRFDKALDLLEGREDCLPDLWIEEMDTIESNFANWVVEAERRALNVLWRRQNGQHLAAEQGGQTARGAADGSSQEPAGQITPSTGPPSKVDHAATKDVDEHRSQTKHVLLPEHPALEAFSHRPVRKASVKQSLADTNSAYTDPTSSQRSAADEEGKPITRTTTPRTEMVPPEDSGSSAAQLAPEVPIVSHMSQQQGRLADLVALNNEESADDYQRDLMGSDYGDTYAPGGEAGWQHQAFPFLSQVPERPRKQSGTKPPLKLDLTSASHRRGVSEASAAGSAFSEAFSEISNAEIVDATTTQVLASPKITLVDNPFGPGQDDSPSTAANAKPRVQSMHILGKDRPVTEPVVEGHNRSKSLTLTAIPSRILGNDMGEAYHKRSIDDLEVYDDGFSRRQMLHRASTASIEVIPKGHVRRIDSNRKSSREPRLVSIDTEGRPSDALRSLTSTSSIRSSSSTGTEGMITPTPGEVRWRDDLAGHYTAPIQPLSYTGGVARSREETLDMVESSSPGVDRKPQRRQSLDLDDPEPLTNVDPLSVSDINDAPVSLPSTFSPFESRDHKSSASPSKSLNPEATLEAKIKDILINLPTRIRLTSDSDSSGSPMQQSSSNSTRSSTPTPSLTLSPARQDRSNRRTYTGNSEVKVYHLIRSGQPRDAPPTKLHVRLVGENGERVMVRVGGGWADLAEYLREYSLHHGTRTVQEGRFEVANLPSSGVKASDTNGSSPIGPSLNVAKTRSASRADTGFDFGPLASPISAKARRSATAPIPAERKGPRSSSPTLAETPAVRPPPVPVIPTSFRQKSSPNLSTNSAVTIESPIATTEVRSRGSSLSTSTFVTPSPSTPLSAFQAQITRNSIITTHPTITTTSTMSTPTSTTSSPSYTPLGAAGPKGGIKNAKTRAATFGSSASSTPENEAWVQGIVGKARQVSGLSNSSHVTTITGPNNTTTTSTSTSNNRRVSTTANATSISTPPAARASSTLASTSIAATPESDRRTQTPSPSPATVDANRGGSAEKPRSKSSLGIRRVFLRSKKPDKGD